MKQYSTENCNFYSREKMAVYLHVRVFVMSQFVILSMKYCTYFGFSFTWNHRHFSFIDLRPGQTQKRNKNQMVAPFNLENVGFGVHISLLFICVKRQVFS